MLSYLMFSEILRKQLNQIYERTFNITKGRWMSKAMYSKRQKR